MRVPHQGSIGCRDGKDGNATHSFGGGADLGSLPQPLHAMEYALGAQHYHFGLFEDARDDIVSAQNRLAQFVASRTSASRRILDVGCGLGGTSRQLGDAGAEVTAIDPCKASIAYAASLHARRGPSGRVHFAATTLEAFADDTRRGPAAARRAARFDAVVSIEVLQHFPALDVFFAACALLLRPGGVLVVLDLNVAVDVPWSRVPFHRVEHVLLRAAAGGFDVAAHGDLTDSVRRTPAEMKAQLHRHRAGLIAHFARVAPRRPVAAEIDEVIGNVRDLDAAFAVGHLHYHATMLCRR